jgi:hypothetical protein
VDYLVAKHGFIKVILQCLGTYHVQCVGLDAVPAGAKSKSALLLVTSKAKKPCLTIGPISNLILCDGQAPLHAHSTFAPPVIATLPRSQIV